MASEKIKGAFESWGSGASALYLESEDGTECLQSFIEGNEDSFATLHTFESEEEAKQAYNSIFEDVIG